MRHLLGVSLVLVLAGVPASAQLTCTAPNPANRPAPVQQYFMIIVDTSGSMTTPVGSLPSCGYSGDRLGHARCAVKNTVNAFSDRADFGLAQFATFSFGLTNPCYGSPTTNCYQAELNTRGTCSGCGPRPGDASTAAGARILVPVNDVPSTVLTYVDNNCANPEVGPAAGNTPLNGALRDMQRYFSVGWTSPDGTQSFPSPLIGNTFSCRRVNVILLTDGDETCDLLSDAVNAASVLFNTGVTVGGVNYKVRTYVINFAGGDVSQTDQIAAAGGTGFSLFANNEAQLTAAFNAILARPKETLDGKDEDCNGCIDDGISQLTLQKTASKSSARRNSDFDYSITVANAGPTFAQLTLTDPLPPTVTLNSFSAPSQWTCTTPAIGSSGTITCTTPAFQLTSDTFTASVHVTAGAPIGSSIVNNASLTASFGASAPKSASASVLVIANQPPVANAGPNQSLAAGTSCSADAHLDGSASTDPEGDPLTFTWSRPGFADLDGPLQTVTLPPGLHTFTLTVTDGQGGSSTATVSILVTDTIAPSITAPADVTADSTAGSCSATVALGTPTASDNCGTPTITRSPAGNVFPVGTTDVVWTASDGTNSATAVQHVAVRDKTAPSLTVPPAVAGATAPDATGCSAVVTDQQLGTATASDDCGGAVSITRTGVPAGNLFPVGMTTITYTATDAAGNSTTKTQTVTIVDATKPTVVAPPSITTARTGPFETQCATVVPDSTLKSAVATDNCPGVTVTRSGVPPGNVFPVGTTTITYTATDAAGNTSSATQTVIVVDRTTPFITLNGAGLMTLSCKAPYVDPGATATDNCDGDLTASITRSGTVDATTPGTYTVLYTVSDASGNTRITPRTVIVLDDAPPVITSASVTPSELWPPSHKMIPIAVTVAASDACSGTSTCSIKSVTSNEPIDGLGDGDMSPDWTISGMSLSLRAERSGKGTGRIYTITLRCVGGSGQATDKTLTVTVPHDK